jgi:hypothetical protein
MGVESADVSAESWAGRMSLAAGPRLNGMSPVRSAFFPLECGVMLNVVTPFSGSQTNYSFRMNPSQASSN